MSDHPYTTPAESAKGLEQWIDRTLDGGLRIRGLRVDQVVIDIEPEETPALETHQVKPPSPTGNSCFKCGGLMMPSGSCEVCTECGESGGCS
ncbi:MAG: hypothetical protein EA376_00830 [Phycisphaeraceae bacterium]|nr:MAG: hypothetical protein EA376_00830 [Phycisphaeraceae bacterium]